MKKQKDMGTVRNLTAVALAVAVGFTPAVWAEATGTSESSKTVYALTKDASDNKRNAFALATAWEDYSSGTGVAASYAPNTSSAAGLEYIITNNLAARTQASKATDAIY